MTGDSPPPGKKGPSPPLRPTGPETIPEDGSSASTPPPLTPDEAAALQQALGPSGRTGTLGRYALLWELGRGGMGEVYLAVDKELDREVAVKVIRADRTMSPLRRERFLREAQAMGRLNHPNIARVLDIGNDGETIYFAMDYVQGRSLRERIKEGPLPIDEALRLTALIARALHHAHGRGVIHRDVKPGNVLLNAEGEPMLTDFGIAKHAGEESSELTLPGDVFGTPAYMAPEQARGEPNITEAVDLYALGAVLYELICGRPPYEGNPQRVTAALLSEPPPPLSERAPETPEAVSAICACAMSRQPEDRYPSALALAEDLERARAGLQVRPPRPNLARRALRALTAHPRRASFAAAALLLPLALIGGRLALDHHRAQSREELAQAHLAALITKRAMLVAEGRAQEADEALRMFISLEEHQGTRALYEAFRAEAAEALARGDLEGHLSAWARAYAAADDPELHAEALRSLAEAFRQSWRWAPLETLLTTADALGHDDPTLSGMLAQVRLAQGDMVGALAVWPTSAVNDPSALSPDARPIIEALARGRQLGHDSVVVSPVDLDHDGRHELITLAGDDMSVLSPSRPERPPLRWSTPSEPLEHANVFVFQPAEGPLTVLSSYTSPSRGWGATSWILEGDSLVSTGQTDLPLLMSNARADLDGDGHQEMYLGASGLTDQAPRLLQAIQTDGRHWRFEVPEPETAYAASGINRMLAVDLDEDGVQELFVTPGSWTAFDLRALSWTGEPPQRGVVPLKVRARARLGLMGGLTVLRDAATGRLNLIAARSTEAPSRRVFPAETPYGPPGDLWRLTLTERGFDVRPFPMQPLGPSFDIRAALGGDIDGDGLDDLLLDVHRDGLGWGIMLFRQRPDGSFAMALLGGEHHATHLIQADDDPAMELVIKDDEGAIALLGVGDAPFGWVDRGVALSDEGLGKVTAGELLDESLDDDADRAELLADLGLYGAAADTLSTLASFATNPEDMARLRLRAGHLATLAWDETKASLELIEASRATRLTNEVLDEIVRRLTDLHCFDEATRAEERRAERRPAVLRTLTALRDAPTFTPAWDDPAWTIHAPDSLRLGPAPGTLRVSAYADQAELATLPLTCSGPRLGLSVDMTVHSAEWASGVELVLRSGDPSHTHGVSFVTTGGGLLYTSSTMCLLPGQSRYAVTHSTREPSADMTWTAAIDLNRDDQTARCLIDGGDGANAVRSTREAPSIPPERPDEDWELIIRHNRDNGVSEPLLAQATLQGLRVTGCRVRDARPAPTSAEEDLILRSHRALLLADGEAALRLLTGLSAPRARAARAVALHELDRAHEAAKAALFDEAAEVRAVIGHLLRSSGAFNAAARAVSAPMHLARFTDAWESVLHHHPDARQVQRALSDWVGELDALAKAPLSAKGAGQLGLVLVRRADIQQRQGLHSSALASLATLLQLAEPRRGQGQLTDPKLLAEAWRLRCQVLLREGDVAGAYESARVSIEVAQSPILQQDRLALIPELKPHLGDPRWTALLGL